MGVYDLIVRGRYVVTCDAAMTVIEDGAIAVRDGVIAAVGPAEAVGRDADRLVEAPERILMPGLINMHCHAGDSLFRGLVEDLPLEPWLETVWKAERAILNRQTCRVGAELGLAEQLIGGVTTVMDMFWHPEATVEAARELGMRLATGGIFFDYPGMDGKFADARPGDTESFFAEHAGNDRVIVGVQVHGTYTVSPEALKVAGAIAERHGAFFSTHAAETEVEQATVSERYGRRVVEHLDDLGLLGPRTVLAHCVHLSDDERAAIARSGTHVVHNPLSNLKLASGFAPVAALHAAGVNLTLGTDGAISGNDLDMFLAMRLCATLAKAATGDAAALTTHAVLAMATRNAARALGREDSLGSLEVGKAADFVTLAIDRLHAAPLFDPITHIVYSANRADVADVYVAGRELVSEGRLVTTDASRLIAEARALVPAILASVGRA
jgi:5-methylthioadenosine/S-adenosylhomocysteine deaminase